MYHGTTVTNLVFLVPPGNFCDLVKIVNAFLCTFSNQDFVIEACLLELWFLALQEHFHVKTLNRSNFNMSIEKEAKHVNEMVASAVYLQVSTISQALIFVTRSRGWSFTEQPGLLLVIAFILAQLVIIFYALCFSHYHTSGSITCSETNMVYLHPIISIPIYLTIYII